MLFYLEHMLRNRLKSEQVVRAALYILKNYQVQIKQNKALLPIVKSLQTHMKCSFKEIRDVTGMNLQAVRMISNEINDNKNMENQLDF